MRTENASNPASTLQHKHNPLPPTPPEWSRAHVSQCPHRVKHTLQCLVQLPLATWKTQQLTSLHLSSGSMQTSYFPLHFLVYLNHNSSRAEFVCHKVKLLSNYDHNLSWGLYCLFLLQYLQQ